MLKPLYTLEPERYQELLTSSQLYDLYPEASGDYTRDTQVTLEKLLELMHEADHNHDRVAVSSLYDTYLKKAIQLEGVNADVADIIISEAYDRGHSAGYSEVVCVALNTLDFVNRILKANQASVKSVTEPVKPVEENLKVSTLRF